MHDHASSCFIYRELAINRLLLFTISEIPQIGDHSADIYARDDENNTSLHVAALSGNERVTLSLIDTLGCDIFVKGGNGYSLLHSACHKGHSNLIETLCKYMSPLILDEDGNTPLHISSVRSHSECVDSL